MDLIDLRPKHTEEESYCFKKNLNDLSVGNILILNTGVELIYRNIGKSDVALMLDEKFCDRCVWGESDGIERDSSISRELWTIHQSRGKKSEEKAIFLRQYCVENLDCQEDRKYNGYDCLFFPLSPYFQITLLDEEYNGLNELIKNAGRDCFPKRFFEEE